MEKSGIEKIAVMISGNYSYYNKVLELSNKKSRKPIIKDDGWNLYSYTFDQRKMFIMQNPGEGKNKDERKKTEEESKSVCEWQNDNTSDNLIAAIEIMQKGLINWLKKHEHFWEFFRILSNVGLIKYKVDKDCFEYIKDHFLEDFYVTDLFKYRVSTGKIGNALYGQKPEKAKFRDSLMKTLEDEINYVKPEHIFVFSTKAWEAFYTYFETDNKIKLVGKEPKELNELEDELKDESKERREKKRRDFLKKVTRVHGLAFELTKFEHKIIVIPLCHFSPRYYNNLILGSYFRYLA